MGYAGFAVTIISATFQSTASFQLTKLRRIGGPEVWGSFLTRPAKDPKNDHPRPPPPPNKKPEATHDYIGETAGLLGGSIFGSFRGSGLGTP